MGTINNVFILHGWSYQKEGNDPLQKWQPLLDSLKNQGINANLLKIPVLTLPSTKPFNLDDYINWLKNETEKNVSGKVTLVGHSNGGRIALAFTHKYPEKVTKLVLIDSAGIYHNELPLRLKRLVFGTLARVGKKLSSSESLKKALYKLARERDYSDSSTIQKETMKNLIKNDLTPILPNISQPTLIIWGSKDKTTPISDAKLLNSLIKNSKLEIITDARHSPQFTHVEKVANLISSFL